MTNLSEKAPFVKSILDNPPKVEITAIFDYHSRRCPDLVANLCFTLDTGPEHVLSLYCIYGEPVFTLNDVFISLSCPEEAALIRAVLGRDHAFRLTHPDCVTLFVDSDRLREVLP